MSVFLDQFVKKVNQLAVIGIPSTIKNKNCRIKLFVLLGVVDTSARAPMNGTMQFNGYFGCDWCQHRGKFYEGSMKYPYMSVPATERDKI